MGLVGASRHLNGLLLSELQEHQQHVGSEQIALLNDFVLVEAQYLQSSVLVEVLVVLFTLSAVEHSHFSIKMSQFGLLQQDFFDLFLQTDPQAQRHYQWIQL